MHSRRDNLLDANDTAAPTLPGIPGRQGKSVVALAEIVHVGVNDYGPTHNVVRSAQGDDVVGDVYYRISLGIRLDISQIADVSDGVLRRAMSHLTELLVCSSVRVISNIFSRGEDKRAGPRHIRNKFSMYEEKSLVELARQ